MGTPKIPTGARRLRTYAELWSYLVDFAERRYPFLWVVGRPGLAKTELINSAVRGQSVYYRKGGQLTPLQFYIGCHAHRGQPIILDDAEHLLDSWIGRSLVSALGETTESKLLCYATTPRVLGDVPDRFRMTSPLCVISNSCTKDEAIQSRAVTLYFEPTNLEIHRDAASWYGDQEIHNWFGQHLYRLPPIDIRWYVTAYHDRRAGRDWRQIILTTHTCKRPLIIIQDLKVEGEYPTREAKARRFVELMRGTSGASRATYFRLFEQLERQGRLVAHPVPSIHLTHSRPPATPSPAELDAMDVVPAGEPREEARPIDLPAREEFARPIRSHGPAATASAHIVLDDTVAFEHGAGRDEEDPTDG
jgi:hypothetical protein